MSSSSNLGGCAKALCPSVYSTNVLRPAAVVYFFMTKSHRIFNVSDFTEGSVLFTSLKLL